MPLRCRSLRTYFHSLIFAVILVALRASAHEGVTYPIAVDQVIPTRPTSSSLSIIADPDLGKGRLDFVFKSKIDLKTLKITTRSSPENIPDLELISQAEYLPEKGSFRAKIPFSSEGRWRIHFSIQQDTQNIAEFVLPLDVVPEGPSRAEFFLYMMPFLAMAFLGLKILRHKKKQKSNP